MLIGGVPGNSAEEVFRTVAPILGDLAIGFTDGEFGVRRFWIYYVVVNTWAKHPDLELIRPVVPAGRGLPDFVPKDYDTLQWYGPKPGVKKLSRIETLGYPNEAAASYKVFCRLRDEGVIPQGVRFQQSLPFPDDACRLFTNNAQNVDLMVDSYVDVMKRDVARLCEIIPHNDLVIQWDINWETVALRELNAPIPKAVPVGMHLCYGDLHHKHFKDPADLATSVSMANKAQEASPQPISHAQMSVPRHRSDDAYFAPLKNLRFGNGTVYAGLVHYTDGAEGSLRRLATFKRHCSGPTGVATECGLGRRPADQSLKKLLEIHRDVAAAI